MLKIERVDVLTRDDALERGMLLSVGDQSELTELR